MLDVLFILLVLVDNSVSAVRNSPRVRVGGGQ